MGRQVRKEPGRLASAKFVVLPREARLVLNSTIIDDYPVLKAVLEKYEQLSVSQYNSLTHVEQMQVNELFESIHTESVRQWKVLEDKYDLKETVSECMLCGQRLRHEYFIRNLITGKELTIGKECADEVGIQTDGSMSLNALHTQRLSLMRRAKATEMFPGLHNLLDGLHRYLESTDILVPKRLEDPFKKIGNQIRSLYRAYLDGDFKKEDEEGVLRTIGSLREQLLEHQKLIERYVEEHKNDPWRPKRSLIQHLQSQKPNGYREVIRQLKIDEVISANTLPNLDEPEFLKWLIVEWNRVLPKYGIVLNRVDVYDSNYIFNLTSHESILMKISHYHLSLLCARALFNPGDIGSVALPLTGILNVSTLVGDDSHERVINLLKPYLADEGLVVYRVEEQGRLVLKHRTKDLFIKFDSPVITNECKGLALGIQEDRRILTEALARGEHMTEAEFRDREEIERTFG